MTAAQETDIAVGSCVEVRHANRTPPTAKTVIINTDAKAKCTPTSTATEAKGAVTAVTPQAITVSAANGATPVTLPSDPKTRYLKTAEASALVIVPGACLSAAGLQDGNGAVQASSATVRPAINGNCPGA
ncbi:hypothetical protein FK535_07550 [Mycolicibacterium sp. 018/SC-01/001]|nr:hypothetical protein FK535_07550 [Mycolicibacterium sp. 018/SC-01/001]